MAISIPPYNLLKSNFPAVKAESVKKLIGGNVDAPYIRNTCAIRISRALNYSGAPLPSGTSKSFVRVSGADKKWYALRIRELRTYLQATYGPPSLKTHKKIPPSEWALAQGIIMFDVHGWTDATGHMDLWNGYTCEYEGYWSRSFEVYLWASKSAVSPSQTNLTNSP